MCSLKDAFDSYYRALDWSYVIQLINDFVDKFSDSHRIVGSELEKRIAERIYNEFSKMGLNAHLEEVPVTGWAFSKALVRIKRPFDEIIDAWTFPGVDEGRVVGELVYVGEGFKDSYSQDVSNKIALVEVDFEDLGHIPPVLEGTLRGASGFILASKRHAAEGLMDAVYVQDGAYERGLPPMVCVSFSKFMHLVELTKAHGCVEAELIVDSKLFDDHGYNVVATYEGRSNDAVILTAHHDGYFRGVLDNLSGVALLLSYAKMLVEGNVKLNKSLTFVSFTAEEYGATNTVYDYLIGSHYFYSKNRDLLRNAWLNINFDAVGCRNSPVYVFYTKELESFLTEVLNEVYSELKAGYVLIDRPSLLFDQWCAVYSGVSSMTFSDILSNYYKKYYHTQYDAVELLDEEHFREYFGLCSTVVYSLDRLKLPPFNLADYVSSMLPKLSFRLASMLHRSLLKNVYSFSHRASEMYHLISAINRGEELVVKADKLSKIKSSVLKVRSIALRGLNFIDGSKIGYVDFPVFPFELSQNVIVSLEKVLEELFEGTGVSPLNSLKSVPSLDWGQMFSLGTYKWILERISKGEFWAKDRVLKLPKLSRVLESTKNVEGLVKAINEVLAEEREGLRRILINLSSLFEDLGRMIETINEWIRGPEEVIETETEE